MDLILNGLTYAYIGDAYYELFIRRYLVDEGLTSVGVLHKRAVTYTSSTAQAMIMTYLMETRLITSSEEDMFKHGRNQSGPGRKNVDAKTYHLATGFESLIGHLCLSDPARADEIIRLSITFIERGQTDGENGHQQHIQTDGRDQ